MDEQRDESVKSRAVTAVGIINLLSGAACLALAVWSIVEICIFAANPAAAGPRHENKIQDAVAEIFRVGFAPLIIALVLFTVACLVVEGSALLLSGVGVLRRRHWGRTLTLVLVFLHCLAAGWVALRGEVLGMVVAGMVVGYCALCFAILRGNRGEFTRAAQGQ